MRYLLRLFLLAVSGMVSIQAYALCTAANPNNNVIEYTPLTAFTITDNTVTHHKTGLIWARCSQGQSWNNNTSHCDGSAAIYSWEQGLNEVLNANNSAFLGFSDWRVPNQNELLSIVEYCGNSPAINETVFPDTPSLEFWSATSYAVTGSNAWYVDFGDGSDNAYLKTSDRHLRLVRGGQQYDAFDQLFSTSGADCNADGNVNIQDVICVINWVLNGS